MPLNSGDNFISISFLLIFSIYFGNIKKNMKSLNQIMNYTEVELFDYPTGRICGVFQDNMKPCQLLSDGICFSPIFRRAGSLPFSNQTFNFSNIQTSLADRKST